ncbi:DNA-binding protein HEXBP [Morella rubra]|uniref:DNA-binding protein HEXBP n=1 Tax=Morella rubra TaxID=262757 RepID=A0A6A1V3X4_9ROSI|nr:DNA-binding protein HEXBP [Morella rubra]
MSSLCSSFRILAPQWRHKSLCFLIFVHSKRNISFTPGVISSSTSEDSVPSPKEMLQSLNAKTGLFSKRMKIIHRDPKLHAQRVAAIKKAKGTAAARRRASEALKAFFSDPENRHKRSIAMKGVKFYCKNCGREGHRRHYCPELKDSLIGRQFRCRLCGEKGHNRRTCRKSRSSNHGNSITRNHRCRLCSQSGHNRRTCPQVTGVSLSGTHAKRIFRSRTCTCQLCQEKGHNIRTCPIRIMNPIVVNPQSEEGKQ